MSRLTIPTDWLPQYTYKDYEKWEGDWELIRGIPYAMSPGPLRRHQFIGGKFVTLANNQLQNKEHTCKCEVLYETDWIIDESTIVRPDVMILCDSDPTDFVRTTPSLIVEIFSPATRLKDRNLKFNLYQDNGVRFYLMIDPDKQSVEAFALQNKIFEKHTGNAFDLTPSCSIDLQLEVLWK